ncbi:MAG TPA: S8 family serine peptidase [Candidatus Binatia bacterium]
MRRFGSGLLLTLAAVLLAASAADAQLARRFKSELYEANPDLTKVASPLLEARKLAREGKSKAQVQRAVPALPFRAGLPEIEVRLSELTPEILDQLRAAGLIVEESHPKYARVIGWCDPLQLDAVAAIPQVRTIHPNYPPEKSVGAVTSQADLSIAVQQARAEFGVDGSGVPVGILSDSFAALTPSSVSGVGCSRLVTGTSSQLTADLPPTVQVLEDFDGEDEGRAMAELVHDLAPGSPILFHTAFESEAGFASGIDALRACGAKVIVDDVSYLTAPMFQDGIVAQAAQAAVEAGVPYFSSAGNQGRFGVDAVFTSAVPGMAGFDLHDFGGGQTLARITLPDRCRARAVLQWTDPFDGTLGPGATTDLDLLVFSCSDGSCDLRDDLSSVTPQGCSRQGGVGGDPVELVALPQTSGEARTYYLAVDRACGDAKRFRVVLYPSCTDPANYDTEIFRDAEIAGHAAAAGVIAVAAVDYREIDSGGAFMPPADVINVQRYSSLGGEIPFYFGPTGEPLPNAPVLRAKPEIAAPDGTDTTFFIPGVDPDNTGFPNFFGTSAAAPHAAAVAALMLQKNPTLSPAGVLAALIDSALDIEAPGYDFLSGYGLVDAVGAVAEAAKPAPSPTLAQLENPAPGSAQSGIGLISGWVCNATKVQYQVDGGEPKDLAYGTSRLDTVGVCGDADNGFGGLLSWSVLGDGEHTLRVLADGVEIASSTFTVTTFGVEFLAGASGDYPISNFPRPGDSLLLRWQEPLQSFVIAAFAPAPAGAALAAEASSGDSATAATASALRVRANPELDAAATQASPLGVLENPAPSSFQSGIGIVSGWVCDATEVTLSIDGGTPSRAGYGTSRRDTEAVCGDTDNGFGLLLNWALLGDGTHTVTAYADGVPFGEATFTVTTLGSEFVIGATGEYVLPDFAGRDVTVRWEQAQQGFVIVDVE